MSYIRNGEDRRYFEGHSNVYLYPSGGSYAYGDEPDEEQLREGGSVSGKMSRMTETDLAEVALRVVERTDVDDDTFEEVVEAVTEHYPRTFERPPSAPLMADALHNDYHVEVKGDAIDWLRECFPEAFEAQYEAAYELWEQEYGN